MDSKKSLPAEAEANVSSRLGLFYVLAILFSWSLWSPLALFALRISAWNAPPFFHLLGGLGPLLATLCVLFLKGGRPGLRSWVRARLHVAGQGPWLLFGLLAPAVLFWVAAISLGLATAHPIEWSAFGQDTEYGLKLPLLLGVHVFFYGLGEEVGWRGFALPLLQRRYSALISSLIVSVAWAAWHLPLFVFAKGMSALGLGGSVGWLFSIVTGSVLMTWLFNSSRGSLMAVALFHGALDVFMAVPPDQGMLNTVMGALITVWGVWVVAFFRPHLSVGARPKVIDP